MIELEGEDEANLDVLAVASALDEGQITDLWKWKRRGGSVKEGKKGRGEAHRGRVVKLGVDASVQVKAKVDVGAQVKVLANSKVVGLTE